MVAPWRGRLFLRPGAMLYVGPGGAAELHAHHAVQLVWARDGRLSVSLHDDTAPVRAALIAARAPHAFDARDRAIALLLVEPHGLRGGALDRRAATRRGADVVAELAAVAFPAATMTADAAARGCDDVMAALGAGAEGPALSSVTRRAVAYIEEAIGSAGRPRLDTAAARVGLSSTRLTHLFTREVGLPFRRFVLWTRIKRAVEATRGGATLTTAAAAAGFSDAAHLSRTFRAMFGLAPAAFLPRVEIVVPR
jgi:AraC-like DNA-binding protein